MKRLTTTLFLVILFLALATTVFLQERYIAEQRETIVKLEAMIMELRRENNEPMQTSQLKIPDPDTIELAVRIIEQEAGNQGAEGKLAVASVLMNRVNDPRFPDDIKSVITSRGQFESYESGRYTRVDVSKESHRAFEKALAGDVITEAVYFCNYENIGTKAKRWFDSLEEVDDLALVYRERASEYVVVRGLDKKTFEWNHGHYFGSGIGALARATGYMIKEIFR